jgi:protein SCO1/2
MKKSALLSVIGFVAVALLIYFLTLEKERYRRTNTSYQIPAVTLLNQHGEPVPLRDFLGSDKPIMLEFIFTSCTTLCPNQSVKFSNFQKKLADSKEVQLISITVDPETDTPEVLRAYLKQYQAQPGWDFLTGSKADIKRVMDAFNIKAADMITLESSLLLRSAKTGQWTKIDGQLTSRDIMQEYQRLLQ